MTTFSDLDLHDATLHGISIAWATREVQAEVTPRYETSAGPVRIQLRWTGCSRIVIPHEAPWGLSLSINSHGRDGERFWIEMQSGDLIELWAEGCAVG